MQNDGRRQQGHDAEGGRAVSKCKACGENFRKGKRRVVLNFDGSLSVAIVCPACVGRAVSIVTPFPRAGLTVSGVELLQRVSDRLRTQHALATMIVQETKGEAALQFNHGRVEALAGAIELIQRAIAGIEP